MKDFFHQCVSFPESQMCLVFFHQQELSFHQDATCQPKLSPCRVPKIRGPFFVKPNQQLAKFVMCHNPNFKKLFQGESFTGLVGVPFLLANVPHLPFSQIARNRLQQFEDQFLEGKILEKQRYAPISIQKWKSESWKGNCT